MKMNNKIYIHSTSCISAQDTFANPLDWHNNIRNPENNLYLCIEPDYRNIIDSASLRRMNRLQKFGLSTAITSLRGINKAVDAIIIGTGWGCIDSTYKFLDRLFDQKELPVNPAVFIQSTHNTIAAQTAIYLKNKAYNNTITDNRLPFELSMDNAILCLQDDDFQNILLGAYDEITPQLIDILNKISKFGTPEQYGEGGACFILSKEKENNIAELKYFSHVSSEDVSIVINDLSKRYSIDYLFTIHKRNIPENIPQIQYVTYFGDFPATSACGFWLALDSLNSNKPTLPHAENILLVSENKQGIAFITIVGK